MSRMLDALKALEKRQQADSASALDDSTAGPMPGQARDRRSEITSLESPVAVQDDWVRCEGATAPVQRPAGLVDELTPPASWHEPAAGESSIASGDDVARQIIETTEALAARIREQIREEQFHARSASFSDSQDSITDDSATGDGATNDDTIGDRLADGEHEIRIVPFCSAVATLAADDDQQVRSRAGLALPIDVDTLRFYRELAARLVTRATTDCCTVALVALSAQSRQALSMSNLAVALGEQNKGRVLLLEQSGRRTGSKAPAERREAPGWADALLGLASWDEVIQTSAAPGVSLARRGRAPYELHDEPSAFSELRSDFRFVLIEAGVAADEGAAWLCAQADRAYAVLELGQMRQNVVRDMLADLAEVGVQLDGIIAMDPCMQPL